MMIEKSVDNHSPESSDRTKFSESIDDKTFIYCFNPKTNDDQIELNQLTVLRMCLTASLLQRLLKRREISAEVIYANCDETLAVLENELGLRLIGWKCDDDRVDRFGRMLTSLSRDRNKINDQSERSISAAEVDDAAKLASLIDADHPRRIFCLVPDGRRRLWTATSRAMSLATSDVRQPATSVVTIGGATFDNDWHQSDATSLGDYIRDRRHFVETNAGDGESIDDRLRRLCRAAVLFELLTPPVARRLRLRRRQLGGDDHPQNVRDAVFVVYNQARMLGILDRYERGVAIGRYATSRATDHDVTTIENDTNLLDFRSDQSDRNFRENLDQNVSTIESNVRSITKGFRSIDRTSRSDLDTVGLNTKTDNADLENFECTVEKLQSDVTSVQSAANSADIATIDCAGSDLKSVENNRINDRRKTKAVILDRIDPMATLLNALHDLDGDFRFGTQDEIRLPNVFQRLFLFSRSFSRFYRTNRVLTEAAIDDERATKSMLTKIAFIRQLNRSLLSWFDTMMIVPVERM